MKTAFLAIFTAALAFLHTPAANAQTSIFLFKVGATLPASMTVSSTTGQTIVSKTLRTDDMINLALGRPLATKVDPKTEVLAAAVTYEISSGTSAPLSRLVVCNPQLSGTAKVVVTVAQLNSIEFATEETGLRITGFGIAGGTLNATTMGTPSQNGFVQSTFNGAGSCAGPNTFGNQHPANAAGKGVVFGEFKFNYTVNGVTTHFDGYVTDGKLTLTGNAIGMFNE